MKKSSGQIANGLSTRKKKTRALLIGHPFTVTNRPSHDRTDIIGAPASGPARTGRLKWQARTPTATFTAAARHTPRPHVRYTRVHRTTKPILRSTPDQRWTLYSLYPVFDNSNR